MIEEIRALQQTLKGDPSNRQAFDALADLFAAQGDWRRLRWHYEKFSEYLEPQEDFAQLVFVLRELAQAEDRPSEASAILVALGDVLFEHLHNHDEGMAAYQTAFRTYPDDTTSLDRARGIYRNLSQFKRVLLIYELECNVKKGTPALLDVQVRMAQVHGDFLGDHREALRILSQVLSEAPDHELAARVQQIYEAGGSVEASVQDKVREGHQAAQSGDAARAARALLEAAQLERFREGGGLKKAAELAEKAREFDADNPQARAFLAQIYETLDQQDALQFLNETGAEDAHGATPAEAGEPAAQSSEPADAATAEGDVPQQAEEESVEESVEESAEESDEESGEESAEEPIEDDNVSEDADSNEPAEPGEAQAAVSLDETALEADGGQPGTLAAQLAEPAAEELSGAQDGADEVQEVSDNLSEESSEGTEIETFEQAQAKLAKTPANLAALAIVRAHLRREGALEELAEQLANSVKYLRKKEGELEVMVELAVLYWRELGNLEQAEYYFKRIKLLDAEQAEMLAFYEDFYEREGDWRKLFALLSARQENVQDEAEALELATRLAQLAEIQMESPERAIDVWKQFEREHPGAPQAREQLRRLYEENGKWNALVDFLKERVRVLQEEAEASGADNAGARVLLLERIAAIYRDELRLDTMVIHTLSSILELEPDHAQAFDQLREKLAEGRRWNDLANLLLRRADLFAAQDQTSDAVDYYLQVADIWQENLRNITQALPHLERVLELDPDNTAVRARLADIYEQRRDYESLFELKFVEAEHAPATQREALLQALLELAETRLSDPTRNVRVLKQLSEIRSDDADLLAKQEFIYRRINDFEGLAEVLEARAALVQKLATGEDEEHAASEALREAARLRESQVGDAEGAARIWKKLLTAHADDQEALGRLTDIYIESEQFDALQALYAGRGELDELCQLLSVAAQAQPDAPRKRALYRRAADIATDPLGDHDLAIDNLNALRALLDDPRDVARELIAHFRALQDLGGQVGATRLLLKHAEDDSQRFEHLQSLAELQRQSDDLGGALESLLQAATLQPASDAVLDAAETVARDGDAMGLFVEHLELIADEADDPSAENFDVEVCARLWQRLGRVLSDDQQNYPRAIHYFERLREQAPYDLKVLDRLEALYARTDQPHKRIGALRDAIDALVEGGADRVDLVDQLSKIADVQRTHLGETDAARSTYLEILDLEPDHLGALRGVRSLQRDEGLWEEVVDSLHREISLLGLDEIDARAHAQMELADTLRLQLGDLREAIHCYGQVLAEQPMHEEAIAAVEALLAEPTLAREAALMLEPIFRDADRPRQLARALQARRAVCTDRFEEAEILDELIPLYRDRLDERATAFEHACRQFELDPGREEIWLRVEQLGASLNRWADIEQIFSKYLSEDAGHGGRVDLNLLRHLAAIREYQLKKPQEALAAWQQIYESDPTDPPVLDALERLYRQLGHQRELVEILGVRESLSDNDQARIDLLLEIAALYDAALEDAPRTIDTYRQILLIEQDHPQAVEQLAGLYRSGEAWFDLDELYATQADLAVDPERRRDFLLSLGRLRAEERADYVGAQDILAQLVTEDPGDADAVAALEALDATLAEQGDQVELRLDIAQTLEPVYRTRQAPERLAAVLEIRQAHILEPFEKVALLDELVALYLDEIGDESAGFDALRRAVLAEPEAEDRRARLLDLCVRLDRLEDGAQVLEDAVIEADALSVGSILRQLGVLYEDLLRTNDRAIDAFERALAHDESDEESMRALERLYQEAGDSERLAQNLRQQVAFGDPGRRAELLGRVATLYEDVLERPEDAVAAYFDLLDEQPDAREAFEGLERVLSSEARWIDLSEVIRRRAEATYDDAERIAALERLAVVFADRLQDRHEAVAVYREILALDPAHRDALDALEAIFEEDAQWVELSEVLRNKLTIGAAEDDAALNALQLKLARILRAELFELDEALDLYRRVLARTPGEPEAIEALHKYLEDPDFAPQVAPDLIDHLHATGQHAELVELYRTRIAQTYEPAQKAEFFQQVAAIYTQQLNDAPSAADALGEAWKLQPERRDLQEKLFDLVRSADADSDAAPWNGWARLAEIHEDVLTEVSEPEAQVDLYLELAKIYRDQLDDALQAETNLREVLALDEHNEQAYSGLESLLITQDRWLDFVELLEQAFNVWLLDEPTRARDTLGRIALVQEEQLQDGFSAVETWRRVLELDESDADANDALARLLRQQERWQDLVEHLQRRLQWTSDLTASVALKQQLGDVLRTQLNEPEAAVELYRQILADVPDHAEALTALEAQFDALMDPETGESSQPELRAEIARATEPVYRQLASFPRLVEALLAQVNPDDPDEAGNARLQEAAQLAEVELNDRARAADITTRLMKRTPHDRANRAQLHRLYTHLGDWPALVELYADVLASNFEVDDTLRVELLCELGALNESHVEDLEGARRAYGEVLLFDVDNREAIDAIERLLVRTQNWLDLAEFYRDRADADTDPLANRRWLEHLATLYEEVLNDLDEAIAVYGRVYDLEPGDARIQQTLARLYGHAHRWHDLADLYRQRIATSLQPRQTMELRFKLAALLEGELDLIPEALQVYAEILAEAPEHQDTLRALEGLQRDLGQRDDERAQYRPQVIDLLLAHYNEKNHWRRIADLLDEKQKLVDDVDGQVHTLSEMAELIQRSASEEADKVRALVKLTRAFCIDPTNQTLRERVHAYADQLEAWERVVPIYLQSLETSDDADVQAALLVAIAQAYSGPLDDVESALVAYQQAVDLNGDAYALGQLQRLYGELELWAPLVGVLRQRLEGEFETDARQSLLKRIALIYDEVLNQPQDAALAYEEMRAEDPTEVTVLQALARLYREDGRWADLAEILQAMVDLTADEDARADYLLELARVQDERLGRSADAILSYSALLGQRPADLDLLRALSRLYEGAQQWPELLANLAQEAELLQEDDELNRIDMRIAVVLLDKLNASVDALEPLERVAQRDPAHPEASEMLAELLDEAQTREDAARILQQVYRSREDFGALRDLYERRLEYVDDPQLRAEIFMELAALHEDAFESPQRAFMTLGRALAQLPGVEFIRLELERLSQSLGNADELAAVYEDTLETGTMDPDVELLMRQRVGQLYVDPLQDLDAAITHLEAALQMDEYNLQTLDWLDRLYQHANRWQDLAEILKTRLAVAEPEQLNDVRFRLGYLQEVVFGEHLEALELYRQIIVEEPEHGGALEGLGRMVGDLEIRREICDLLEPSYQALEAHEALCELYELKVEVADSSDERAELYRRIAALQMESLGDVYAGYAYLGRALREAPHDIELQQQLESLAGKHDLQEQLVALYEDIIDQLDDPIRAAELALIAGDDALDILQEPARAAHLYQIVLKVEPDHAAALAALENIARTQDQPIALEMVLRQKIQSLFDPDARKKALLELGEVRMRLEMFDEAIAAYQEALTLDEGDLEVLHQLVALFEITERYDGLVDTLERLAGLIKDVDEQRLLYVRIGQYTRHFIHTPERAIDAYRRADELSPNHPEVIKALESLYEECEKWHDLLDLIERQLQLLRQKLGEEAEHESSQAAEFLRLYVKRATLYYQQFSRLDEAIADYQRAFAIQKDSALVVEALDKLYRAEARWEDLLELYTEQLEIAADQARLIDLHVEIADIDQTHLHNDASALQRLDMVLEVAPDHARALAVLESIYRRVGEWAGVAGILERKAQGASGEEKIALLLERADVLERKLHDPSSAANVLVSVLSLEPAHAPTIEKLKELYQAQGEYAQLYAILEHEVALAPSDEVRVQRLLQMAEVARTRLDSPARRAAALQQAYALRPADLEIVEPLLDAYISAQDFERAEPLLAEIIETLLAERRMVEVARFEHLRGKLAEQKGDLTGAQAAYEAAHKVDATYVPNLLSLGKLLVHIEDWDQALKIFQTLLLHQMSIQDNAQKVDLYYYLGQVRLQKGDARRARDMFNRALGIDANHQPSQQALAALNA